MLTYTQKLIDMMLSQLIDSTPIAGVFSNVQVMLYTNNIAVTPDLDLGDLTEATFSGYARVPVTWDDVVRHSSETGAPVIVSEDVCLFARTAGGLDQTVRGYALVTPSPGSILLAVRALDTPEAMEAGGVLSIVPRLGYNPEAVIPSGDVTAT